MYDFNLVSNIDIHNITYRATPEMHSNYSHAVMLYDIINCQIPDEIYNDLLHNSLYESRKNLTYFANFAKTRIGLNWFPNRLNSISKLIPPLPGSYALEKGVLKEKCKRIFQKNSDSQDYQHKHHYGTFMIQPLFSPEYLNDFIISHWWFLWKFYNAFVWVLFHL